MLSLRDILQVLISSSLLRDLFDLLKQLRGSVMEQYLQGIYEVLDQRYTVTSHDAQGRVATVDTVQHLRFRQNHVTAITECTWGEGELFAAYHCTPGVPVDCYREGSRHVMLISLREHRNVGDELILHTRRRIENGFRKREEYWESDIYHRTQKMELRIIFPEERPCERATVWLVVRGVTVALGPEHYHTLPDGRHLVSWVSAKPRLNERYPFRWMW